MPTSHAVLDQVDIAFDGQRAVASAELLLATLAERLGIEQAADQHELAKRPSAGLDRFTRRRLSQPSNAWPATGDVAAVDSVMTYWLLLEN